MTSERVEDDSPEPTPELVELMRTYGTIASKGDIHGTREELVALIGAQSREIGRLLAQFPSEMQGRTILFKECEKGHGRLIAKNWIDHGCQRCEVETLREWKQIAQAALILLGRPAHA